MTAPTKYAALPALLLAAALLTGCATAPPEVTSTPDLGAPEEWTARIEPAGETTDNWLASFHDPVLDQLVTEALAHNPQIAAAAARLDQAASAARIAGADLQPSVSAGLSGSRRRSNFIGLPIPGAEGGVFSVTSGTYGVSLDVSWEIDLWGRIRAGHSASLADLQAAEASLAAAQLSLAGQTAKAWFSAREAARQLELARETLVNFEKADRGIGRRYGLGTSGALDRRLSLGNVASAEALLAARQRQLDAAARQLEILLGRYPAAELQIINDLPPTPEAVPAGIPADVVSRRPDLVIAERQLAAAGARLQEARKSLYPRLTLTGSAGTSSPELEDMLDTDLRIWSLVEGIVQPIFQGGRLRENVRLNEARVREAAENFAGTLLSAYGEVELALAAEQHLASQERALIEATRQSTAARELADDQYRRGLVDILTLLEAQRRALQSEGELIAVQRERLANRIDLHLALGGAFSPSTTGANES